LAIVAAMIGGVAMARAVRKARPRLSDDILEAVRHAMSRLGSRRGWTG
jgi:hypothetical protein